MEIALEKIRYYRGIDALKGVAIFLVMSAHIPSSIIPQLQPPIGQYGVQLFFILSALSIFASYERRQHFDEKSTATFFFIRRFFRIAPLFYGAIIFYILYSPLPLDRFNYYILLSVVLFVNSFWPFNSAINYLPPGGWAVAIEMVFYALVPWLFKKICDLRSALVLAILSTSLCLIQYHVVKLVLDNKYSRYQIHQYVDNVRGWYYYFWFPSQFFAFTLGIVLYFVLVKKPDRIQIVDKHRRSLFVLLLLSLAAAIFVDTLHQEIVPMHLLYSLGFFLFSIWIFIANPSVFVNKFTVLLGQLSFNLYLVHFFVQDYIAYLFQQNNLFTQFSYARPLYLLLCLICPLFISYITHVIIEKPGIRAGRALIDVLRKRKIAAAEKGTKHPGGVVS